jgi:hypothetical protein
MFGHEVLVLFLSKLFFLSETLNAVVSAWATEENHKVKVGNKSFETVKPFKYLGIALTNQNFIREQITNRICLPVFIQKYKG